MDNHTITYQYDGIGRLIQEKDPSWNTIAYEYDQYSNRAKMTVSGSENHVTTYEYQQNNWLVKENKRQGQVTETFTYRYDDNGNQVYREWEKTNPISAEPGKIYFQEEEQKPVILDMREYNGFNQLVKTNRFPINIHYRYRPDGLRHNKIVTNPFIGKNESTIHYWNGTDIVMEAVDGNIASRYLRGIDLVAQQIGNSLNYYLYNMCGDVIQLIGGDGNSTHIYEYDAFGNERNPNSNDPNPFRYCGEYWDLETQSYYLRARYYSPKIGRFTQEDPCWNTSNMIYGDNSDKNKRVSDINAIRQSTNLYVYGLNNPLRYIDPMGLAVWLIHGTFSNEDLAWTDQFRGYIVGATGVFRGEDLFFGNWCDTGFFNNRAGNSVEAREIGADRIFNEIVAFHRANPDEPIRLVGHSHGGNVAIIVTNMLAEEGIKVNTLITIATPVREFQLNPDVTVGQHINVYNERDRTQIAGGPMVMINGLPTVIPAGRTFSGAENISVSRMHRDLPRSNHSFMHSSLRVWREYIVPLLR